MCDFKLISLNVKGLGNSKKRLGIFRWLKKNKSDIIFVQESHGVKRIEKEWSREWGGEIVFCHGSSNSRGCMILVQKGFECEVMSTKTDYGGRFIITRVEIKGEMFVLINVSAKFRKRPTYFLQRSI